MEFPSNIHLAEVCCDITYCVSFHLLDPGCLPGQASDYTSNCLNQSGLNFNKQKPSPEHIMKPGKNSPVLIYLL